MLRTSAAPETASLIPLADTAAAGVAPAPTPARHPAGTILYLDGVSVSFDGFKALNNLSLVIDKGEMRTIIGPNGAGKTTMMDVITGKTKPDKGDVLFDGTVDLTRLDEPAIANLGIGRKFQKPTVFEHLTVFENLELALKCDRGIVTTLFFNLTAAQERRIDATLGVVGLGDRRNIKAGALSHGQKQWLEIGMLLMQEGKLLLLDEPVAGMTDHETETTARLLLDIARERSVVVVEHDMEFVRALGAKVTVLHEGSMLAEGLIDVVQNDHRVIEVYLGR
jgi:urea transport system ATP-binding protein